METDKIQTELAQLSNLAGQSVDWAQAAGGNASIKDEQKNRLWVKASGLRLSEVSPSAGWVAMNLAQCRQVLENPAWDSLAPAKQQDEAGKAMQAAVVSEGGLRPSLEAGFHALPGRVLLHTHLLEALAGLCLADGEAILREALHSVGHGIVWVNYQPPGQALASHVRLARLKAVEADIILMANHGLLVVAEDAQAALALTRQVQVHCQAAFPCGAPPEPKPKNEEFKKLADACAHAVNGVSRLSQNPWVASLSLGGPWSWQAICPDDVIYVGKDLPLLSDASPQHSQSLPQGTQRAAFALEGVGVVLVAKDERALDFMEELLYANARARAMARGRGEIVALDQSQRLDLLGMDGEKYRQNLK